MTLGKLANGFLRKGRTPLTVCSLHRGARRYSSPQRNAKAHKTDAGRTGSSPRHSQLVPAPTEPAMPEPQQETK
jgi:hypothetical protein